MARVIPGYQDPLSDSIDPIGHLAWRSGRHKVSQINTREELGAGLPSQIAGADDMIAATATVTMSTEDIITEGRRLPWEMEGLLPQEGDHMDVYLGLGDSAVRIIKGRVESTSGKIGDATIQVNVVDRIDDLDREVNIDPLNFRMPPHSEGTSPRLIGLHPLWLTNEVARRSGFYATPQKEAGSWVSAPMVGSVWPEYGELLQAGTISPDGIAAPPPTPTFGAAPWGLAVSNTYASYLPVQRQNPGPLGIWLRYPTYVRFLIGGPIGGSRFRIVIDWAAGHRYLIFIDQNGISIDQFNATGGDVGDGLSRFTMPLPAPVDGEYDVSLWLVPVTTNPVGSDVTVYGRINNTTAQGLLWGTPTMKTSQISRIQVYSAGNQAALGGFQVGSALSRYDLHAWERTARFETDYDNYWSGVPALAARNALDLLKEQAKSELACLWIDHNGHLRYRSLARTLAQEPTEPLTFRSIRELPWSKDRSSVFESVVVKWKQPTANRGRFATAVLWQGNAPQIEPGEVYEEVIHPDQDVDWIGVAEMVKLPNSGANPIGETDPQEAEKWARFRAGIGSWVSAVLESDDSEVGQDGVQHVPISWYSFTFRKIDSRSYLVRVTPTAEALIGARVLSLRSAGWGYLPAHRRAVPMPLVRGTARVQWSELETTGATPGVLGAGIHTHDAGFWIQTAPMAQRVADYFAARTAKSVPVFPGIGTRPDDRRQLGDKVPLDLGSTVIQGLVVGIEKSYSRSDDAVTRTQSLTIKPIEES